MNFFPLPPPRLLMAERFVLMKLVNLVGDLVGSEVLVAGDFSEAAEEEVGIVSRPCILSALIYITFFYYYFFKMSF